MRRIASWLPIVAAASLALLPAAARAQSQAGAVRASWTVTPILKATITPNYQSGFGPQGGNGSGLTPAAGAKAALQGGFVDFGTVVQGFQYLYKYAAQVAVNTNDAAGFTIFGEASTDFNGATTGSYAVANVLYWLPVSAANGPFSAATPFGRTAGTPTNGGQNIAYAGAPPPSAAITTSPIGGTVTQGYDFQLRVPGAIPIDSFSLYVVYTVVGN